ncbi:MAG TPA: ADOP family duplicated permease [Vicinamibacterales bacterium]|nr:ADOP family duplicated permease [Vicinamibacterales bacterium]
MRRSLRSWLWGVPLDQEVDEELAFHIEMRTRELVERGVDPRIAREMVLARLGDVGRLKRTCVDLGRKREREMRLTRWIHEFGTDVSYALRQLKASPGFTLVATITLALGIGANSAMFALADAALFRPLPFRDADRLVIVDEWGPQQAARSRIEWLNFHEWATRSRTFESMAAIWIPGSGGGPAMTGADGTPETVPAQSVTSAFFDVLGVRPIAGRTFRPEDETTTPSVVVMSEGFWRRRFAADPTLVGREITLDGRPMTVIGIVPSNFQFTPGLSFISQGVSVSSLWMLLPSPRPGSADNARGQCGVCRFLQVVGRLRPEASIEAAQSDLTLLADTLAGDQGLGRPRRVLVTPLRESMIGRDIRLTSMLLLGVVGLVLALCCANVANLLLARGTARAREFAVRAALGAGRRRIMAQMITESLVLATLGGLVGSGVGALLLNAARSLIPSNLLPPAVVFDFGSRVAGVAVATALVVGVVFGLVSAWRATGFSLSSALTSESRTTTGRGSWLRNALVVGEVAVAVVVLCGAGLLLRTLLVLDGFDAGYSANRERLLSLVLSVPALTPGSRYPTRESLLQFYEAVDGEVRTIPGVRTAGWATTLPLGGSLIGRQAFDIVGAPPPPDGVRPQADFQVVSPGYFEALELSILSGRAFTDDDRLGTTPVCIVSEAFARRHFPGRNPIGARIRIGLIQIDEREIVGIARQVKGRPDEIEEFAQLYVPLGQNPWPNSHLVVRAIDGDASALAPAVRAAIAEVAPGQAVNNVMTLEGIAGTATERYRFRAALVGAFGSLALLLAMVGVFGVLAYSVQQRTRELGVRIALGATPGNVLRLVFSGGGRVVGLGAALGLLLATGIGQAMSSFLFGVRPLDPVTFVAVGGVLALTALLACAAPAFRAMRVDPVVAFRVE